MAEKRTERRVPGAPARMNLLEQDLRSHAETLTAIVKAHEKMHARLELLEERDQEVQKLEARKEERDKARVLWETQTDKKLDSIQGAGTKLLWLVATLVVGAFIAFIIRGGLSP